MIFHDMLYVLNLTILNLIRISQINLQLSCLPGFSYIVIKYLPH